MRTFFHEFKGNILSTTFWSRDSFLFFNIEGAVIVLLQWNSTRIMLKTYILINMILRMLTELRLLCTTTYDLFCSTNRMKLVLISKFRFVYLIFSCSPHLDYPRSKILFITISLIHDVFIWNIRYIFKTPKYFSILNFQLYNCILQIRVVINISMQYTLAQIIT